MELDFRWAQLQTPLAFYNEMIYCYYIFYVHCSDCYPHYINVFFEASFINITATRCKHQSRKKCIRSWIEGLYIVRK